MIMSTMAHRNDAKHRLREDKCVEVYQCREHGHRFEGPIKRNKKDKDYQCLDDCN